MNDVLTCDAVITADGRTIADPCTLPQCFGWDLESWKKVAFIEVQAVRPYRNRMSIDELEDLSRVERMYATLPTLTHPGWPQSDQSVFEAIRTAQAARCLRAVVQKRLKTKNENQGTIPAKQPGSEPGAPAAEDTWELPGLPNIKLPNFDANLPDLDWLSRVWEWIKKHWPWLAAALALYFVGPMLPGLMAKGTTKRLRGKKR